MAFSRTLQHFTSSQELATIWASGQSYIVNQLVIENDIIYRCLIANTSSLSFSTDLGAGKWVAISAAGAQGSKNYIENGNFEDNNTTGWSLFNTTLTSKIPTGSITAGAASITSFAVDSTTPIAGTYDLRVASSGALTAGQGFISDAFTIDREDQAKPLAFSFAYEAVSGTMNFSGTSNNTFAVYIYDVSGSAWIQPAGVYNLVQSSGVGIASGSFQTTATGTQYRIAVVCITATAGAVEMRFDTFQLGPQTNPAGAAISDWVSSTPTYSNAGTTSLSVHSTRRVGDTLQIQGRTVFATAGAAAVLRLRIPSSIGTIDTTKVQTGNLAGSVGSYNAQIGGSLFNGNVNLTTTANEVSFIPDGPGGAHLGSAFGLNTELTYTLSVPISGWSSNTVMSQDTDTRVVAAKAFKNASSGTQTIAALTGPSTIVLNETYFDTHAAYSTASNSYVFPVSGIYKVGAKVIVRASVASSGYIRLAGTGILTDDFSFIASSAGDHTFDVYSIISADAGDTISLSVRNETAGASIQILSTATWSGGTSLSIERLSGPATIAASETVAMNRCLTGGQSIPSGVDSVAVSLSTSTIDTHGIWVNGTGYNSVTGTWTTRPRAVIPISGKYLVQFALGIPVATGITGIIFAEVRLFRNGVVLDAYAGSRLWFNNTSGVVQDFISAGSGQFNCLAGDELILQVFQGTSPAVNRTLNTEQRHGFFAITKAGY